MSLARQNSNLAARMGRWSAAHWKTATFGWLALVVVEFEIRGDKKDAGDKLGPVLKSVKDAQRAHPGFFIGEFGYASAAKATDTAFANDLKSAGVFSIPLTLIILVIAFGALVAAGI